MKRTLFSSFMVAALLVMAVAYSPPVEAQAPTSITVANARGYAKDSVWIPGNPIQGLARYNYVSLQTKWNDSVKVTIALDFRIIGTASTWTAVDSVTYTLTTAGTFKEWILRDNETEKLGGLLVEHRFRYRFAPGDTVQGLTTPTFNAAIGVVR